MEDSAVRAKVEHVEVEPEVFDETSTVKDTIGTGDKALEEYTEPYLNELLELGEAYNHFDMKLKTDLIDEYIREKATDKDSYKEIFDEMFERAKAKADNVYTVVERVFEYMTLQRRLEQIIQDKKEFEAKDPMEMTADELERWIEENGTKH